MSACNIKIQRTTHCSLEKEKETLAKGRKRDYYCVVVSEDVEITLKKKPSLSFKAKRELFVQCNQSDCQYVDLNQAPCPLGLGLFTDEIERREEKRRDRIIQNRV